MKQWLAYIDDLCVRTGRWREGSPVTDEQHSEMLSKAAQSQTATPIIEDTL